MPGRSDEIAAILDEDLAQVLKQLGVLDEAERGALRCGVCGNPVAPGAIRAIYRDEAEVRVVCDREECLLTFALGE